ncbi:MAG TPA: ATP-dependent DNA helicase RecG, partial [Thermotogota bacterium]|nr:ATP-dependent DNA helicase RecG [Thermotogota bacterium]
RKSPFYFGHFLFCKLLSEWYNRMIEKKRDVWMIILEEWIESTQSWFKRITKGESFQGNLYDQIMEGLREIDLNELKEHVGAKDKLMLFANHYKGFDRLDKQRQRKRIDNAFVMLEKLKSEFLFPKSLSTLENCSQLRLPIEHIRGVGPKRAKLFNSMNLNTLEDLLFHFPRVYDDRRKVTPLSQVCPAEKVTVIGTVHSINASRTRRGMNILQVQLTDESGVLTLKWFNQPYLNKVFKEGQRITATGKVKSTGLVTREMNVAEFEVVNDNVLARKIYPIYPLTAGLYNSQLRSIIGNHSHYAACIIDHLPEAIKEANQFIPLKDAVYGVHQPQSDLHLNECTKRLKFDDFFYFELATYFAKRKREQRLKKIPKAVVGVLVKQLEDQLPFQLTEAQKRVFNTIRNGLVKDTLMNLLIQGDVGSGKTIVALMGMLDVIEAGYQCCIMAPTSILATQHFQNISAFLKHLPVTCRLLISKTPTKEKSEAKEMIASGEVDIVIGTHAVIQEDVEFKKLGLAVIDEQHRFGVRQRETLIKKGDQVDTIVMTATPIPRTLSLSVFGDLDIASIDEMPPGRKPVKTMVLPQEKLDQLYAFLKKEIDNDGQIFIVYPLVEESEALDLKDATSMYESLKAGYFKEHRLGLLHGKMKADEKDQIMEDFINRKYDILVSTTVIEVGIDVPSATVMVIEHPERFGLAQLHQLRGRVGRNKKKGFCFLVTADKSRGNFERLTYFASHNNGFELSEYDLQLRGPGEVMGVRQHGMPSFRLANLMDDRDLLFLARTEAIQLLERDPSLEKNVQLREYIEQAFQDRMNLIDIG